MKTTVLNVPDMHCENCVTRITTALAKKQLGFKVSLTNKTVSINGDEPAIQKAVETLNDLGFEAQRQPG